MKASRWTGMLCMASVMIAMVPSALAQSWEKTTDRPGMNYKRIGIPKDTEEFAGVKQCEDECKKDPQCKAFTYVKPGIQGVDAWCYLKKGVPSPVSTPCCFSGVIRPDTTVDRCKNYAATAVQQSNSNVNWGCGYSGPAWGSNYQVHYGWCVKAPAQIADAETAKRKSMLEQCYAKYSQTRPPATGIAAHMELDTDRPGKNLRSFDLSSGNPALCEDACEKEPNCMAWTFVKPGIKGTMAKCWLKSGIPSPIRSSCCISGVMPLTLDLGESIYVDPSRPADKARDRDGDMLKDDLEGKLADFFRPYYKFDSAENARRPGEPVTIFQARPMGCAGAGCSSQTEIFIKWAFLFIWDGGYGPAESICKDSHMGDNDQALYKLTSLDRGFSWKLVLIALGGVHPQGLQFFLGFQWPEGYPLPAYTSGRPVPALEKVDLELYKQQHPVIYMSAHKHHLYFDTSHDNKRSFYTKYFCDDDVNGKGAQFLSDLHSVFKDQRYNNVGEPGDWHPKGYFVNCMTQFKATTIGRAIDVGDKECNGDYYSAWGTTRFYGVHPNADLWMTHQWWPK